MSVAELYAASPIKRRRRRASRDEIEERALFLIDYANRHGPVTVWQLYYRAEISGLLGIDKTEGSTTRFSARCSRCGSPSGCPTATWPI
jgi:hypothetical protein